MSVAAGSFWTSTGGMGLVLGLSFLAVFLVATMLLGGRARRRREESLARRIGRFRRREPDAAAEATTQTHWVPGRLAEAGERFAVATGFSASLDEKLERAGKPISAGEFIALTVLAALGGAVIGALLLQNIIFVLLIAGVVALLPHLWLTRVYAKRQGALGEQLADTLSILGSSLRAGYSFLQALDTVSKEIGEPSATEFQRVVAEIRLGRPVDEALLAMADRGASDDLRWAVIAINVQRQVGGNLAEILDTVANTVRERAYIRRQVKVLTAEGRLSVAILSGLPFLLLLYMVIVSPDYVAPLFTTRVGNLLLGIGGLMIGTGVYIMSRLVKIDV